MELIRFSCNAGYTEMYQDKGSPWVRCNEGGYDRIPIHCVGEWRVIIVLQHGYSVIIVVKSLWNYPFLLNLADSYGK